PSKLLLRHRLELSTASAPRTGPVAAYGPPGYDHSHAHACQQWPADRASRYTGPWNAQGSAPILVVGTTGDPDTPYQDAVTLAATLENGHLLTFVGEGHPGAAHSPCTQAAEVAYLIDLTMPQHGARCTDDPPPAASVHGTDQSTTAPINPRIAKHFSTSRVHAPARLATRSGLPVSHKRCCRRRCDRFPSTTAHGGTKPRQPSAKCHNRRKTSHSPAVDAERATGIEPAWPAWKTAPNASSVASTCEKPGSQLPAIDRGLPGQHANSTQRS
ncbi:MAG: alpha/beta hydrolase, partial [Actinobacteria bacterium]|nr:alpha/beta hydrolase [Actinomycetota bacterium]